MATKVIQGDDVECVLKWEANVGEGPLWHPHEKKLYWVDILEKKIHRFDPQSKQNETFTLPEIVPCICFRKKGGLVVSLKKSFSFFDPETGKLEKWADVESDRPQNRFNDGKCDPQGRFWAGTMDSVHWDQPKGNLFCLGGNHKPQQKISEVICSNGLGWSPDSRTLYFIESFRYCVFAYDFVPETGEIKNRREFFKVDKNFGFPDGMTVDAEGFVWVNIVGPGEIHRLDSQGRLERVIKTPVQRATSCTFGGDQLKTLYITSSRETLSPEELKKTPMAGSLFAVETDVTGLPSAFYID